MSLQTGGPPRPAMIDAAGRYSPAAPVTGRDGEVSADRREPLVGDPPPAHLPTQDPVAPHIGRHPHSTAVRIATHAHQRALRIAQTPRRPSALVGSARKRWVGLVVGGACGVGGSIVGLATTPLLSRGGIAGCGVGIVAGIVAFAGGLWLRADGGAEPSDEPVTESVRPGWTDDSWV